MVSILYLIYIYMSKLLEIKKTNYYYKSKNGTFKKLYAFKYEYSTPLKKTFRKHFYRFKLSNNKTAKTYHGKFYRKKDITNSKKNKKT